MRFKPTMGNGTSKSIVLPLNLEVYFKIGVSDEYILMRDDFPIGTIPPGEFKALLVKMFKKNDRVLGRGK